mmetsp:Transcript_3091/g.9042  ORF Transcript_3091/g.9042 Transcript_3091/m.9042 type:complete len:890 (+) Transcript_3091:259-2928(+)
MRRGGHERRAGRVPPAGQDALRGHRPEGHHPVDDRPLGQRQVHHRQGPGGGIGAAARQGRADARRRQRAHGPEPGPRLLAGGPRRVRAARGRARLPLQRRRRHHLGDAGEPLPRGARRGPQAPRGPGPRLPGGLHERAHLRGAEARPQGPLRQGGRGRDQVLHGHVGGRAVRGPHQPRHRPPQLGALGRGVRRQIGGGPAQGRRARGRPHVALRAAAAAGLRGRLARGRAHPERLAGRGRARARADAAGGAPDGHRRQLAPRAVRGLGRAPQGLHARVRAAPVAPLQLHPHRPLRQRRRRGHQQPPDVLGDGAPPAHAGRFVRAHRAAHHVRHAGRDLEQRRRGRGPRGQGRRGAGPAPPAGDLRQPQGGDRGPLLRRHRRRAPVHLAHLLGRRLPAGRRDRALRAHALQRRSGPVAPHAQGAVRRLPGQGRGRRLRVPDAQPDARGPRVPHAHGPRAPHRAGLQEPDPLALAAGRLDQVRRRAVGRARQAAPGHPGREDAGPRLDRHGHLAGAHDLRGPHGGPVPRVLAEGRRRLLLRRGPGRRGHQGLRRRRDAHGRRHVRREPRALRPPDVAAPGRRRHEAAVLRQVLLRQERPPDEGHGPRAGVGLHLHLGQQDAGARAPGRPALHGPHPLGPPGGQLRAPGLHGAHGLGHRLQVLPEHRLARLGAVVQATDRGARRRGGRGARAVRDDVLRAVSVLPGPQGVALARHPPARAGRLLQLCDGDSHAHVREDGGVQGEVGQPHHAGHQQGRLGPLLHVRRALLQLRPPAADLGGPGPQEPRRLRRRQRPARRDRDRRHAAGHGLHDARQGARLPGAHRRGRDRPQDHRAPRVGPARALRELARGHGALRAGRHGAARGLAQDVQDVGRQGRQRAGQRRAADVRGRG